MTEGLLSLKLGRGEREGKRGIIKEETLGERRSFQKSRVCWWWRGEAPFFLSFSFSPSMGGNSAFVTITDQKAF